MNEGTEEFRLERLLLDGGTRLVSPEVSLSHSQSQGN